MLKDVLTYFPPQIHPLTLVSDPDHLMAGEALMAELTRREFQVIQEDDPVLLRWRVENAQPSTPVHPVILITTCALEDFSYDLYQPAHRVRLSLHHFFPNLSYPVLQTLNPNQIEKLESCQQPAQTLSRQKTIDYLLCNVFGADPVALCQPHTLIDWLNNYHHQQSQLPNLLRASLVENLRRYADYQDWDIDLLIRDAQAFQKFVQQQWQLSIEQSLSVRSIKETQARYSIPFYRDPQLQDLVPGLVRRGTIQPLRFEKLSGLPSWAKPGITLIDTNLQRMTMLLENVDNQLTELKADPQSGWKPWKEVAQNWSELCRYVNQINLATTPEQKKAYQRFTQEIDQLFFKWLRKNYTALGAQRLPTPHHVHHIPHYLDYLRNLGKIDKVVLMVLDGLSLTDWQVIHSVWKNRHADWAINADMLIAQVPTITSISRFALISGLRPADFITDLEHRVSEAQAWELFWSREGIPGYSCKLLLLSYDRQIDQQPELQDPRVNFWCLIDDTPDKLAHNATLGNADQQSSLRLWLDPAYDQNSLALEKIIDMYLDSGFSVFIASDHGHVEATGFGKPSEGLLAQTRGKRARIYQDRLAAKQVQYAFVDTILWENDDLLPDKMVALMPAKRNAFAPSGELVVTHGGVSIDEMIVPFIQITKESM